MQISADVNLARFLRGWYRSPEEFVDKVAEEVRSTLLRTSGQNPSSPR